MTAKRVKIVRKDPERPSSPAAHESASVQAAAYALQPMDNNCEVGQMGAKRARIEKNVSEKPLSAHEFQAATYAFQQMEDKDANNQMASDRARIEQNVLEQPLSPHESEAAAYALQHMEDNHADGQMVSKRARVEQNVSEQPSSPATHESPFVQAMVYALQHMENNDADITYFDKIPPGCQFRSLDIELIVHYLQRKIDGLPLPKNKIVEDNIYKYHPDELIEQYKAYALDQKEIYFMFLRDKRYKGGKNTRKVAKGGDWMGNNRDVEIRDDTDVLGYKKELRFLATENLVNFKKTSWKMDEYRSENHPEEKNYVLCRLYKGEGLLY